jgi:hypothetical protein
LFPVRTAGLELRAPMPVSRSWSGQQKTRCRCDTGSLGVPLSRWPSVTSASGARGAYSPVDRRDTPRISAREWNSTTKPSCLASPPLGRPRGRSGPLSVTVI